MNLNALDIHRTAIAGFCALLCSMAFASCGPTIDPEQAIDSSGLAIEPDETIDSGASVIEYATASDRMVLSFRQTGGLIDSPDAPPLLRIYGDGMALIHFPAGSRRAGDYSLQLTHSELADLLESLSEKGVMTIQSDDISRRIQETLAARAEAQGGPVTRLMISDNVTTVIEIHLEEYAPAGSLGPSKAPFHSMFSWYALQRNANEFREVDELQQLAAAEKELLRLATRDDMEPTEP